MYQVNDPRRNGLGTMVQQPQAQAGGQNPLAMLFDHLFGWMMQNHGAVGPGTSAMEGDPVPPVPQPRPSGLGAAPAAHPAMQMPPVRPQELGGMPQSPIVNGYQDRHYGGMPTPGFQPNSGPAWMTPPGATLGALFNSGPFPHRAVPSDLSTTMPRRPPYG